MPNTQIFEFEKFKYAEILAKIHSLNGKKCYIVIRDSDSPIWQKLLNITSVRRHLKVGIICITHSIPPPNVRPHFTHVIVMNTVNDADFKKITGYYDITVSNDMLKSRSNRNAGCMISTQNGDITTIRIQM